MTDRKSYDAGWDDCIAYIREKHTLNQSQVGLGMLLMLIGGIVLAMPAAHFIVSLIADAPINISACLVAGIIAAILFVSGIRVDNKDRIRYKQREEEFYRKWSNRWIELGLNGDDK
jgi:hypothetical protein